LGGNNSQTHDIHQQATVPRRTGLLDFHVATRRKDAQRTFWIDALCIDQSNVSERINPVKRMGYIYSRSQQVVVWLGAHTASHYFESVGGIVRCGVGHIEVSDNFEPDTTCNANTFGLSLRCMPRDDNGSVVYTLRIDIRTLPWHDLHALGTSDGDVDVHKGVKSHELCEKAKGNYVPFRIV
jgi:hypothetical protein